MSAANPGELIHIDIKKLGGSARSGHRITGRSNRRSQAHHRHRLGIRARLHRRRLARRLRASHARRKKIERRRLPRWRPGSVTQASASKIERVHDRQRIVLRLDEPFAQACRRLRPANTSGRGPTRPRTNGKAERFIQTELARMGLRASLPEAQSERIRRAATTGSSATTGIGPMAASEAKPPVSRAGLQALSPCLTAP